ncbi:hypothetical protein COJ57_06260 [Bacillus cereus]|nr:hypothetical protein COI85_28605 [Bacillus cereus]PFN38710.1 hypothetical protein COJ57_06260 [Bacillus cereus]
MIYGLFIIISSIILTYYIWKIIFRNFIILDSFIGILGSILGTWFITLILIEMHPIFAIILFTLIMIFKLFSQKKEG